MRQLFLKLVLLGALLGGSISSCSLIDNQANGSSNSGNNTTASTKQLIIDDISKYPQDQVTIRDASIVGDSLTMLVSYSGGCKAHEFKVVASGAIMKSMPPQMNVVLSHNSNGDMCEALLTQDVTVGLNAIKQYASGGIILHLKGFDKSLLYKH